MHTYRANLWSVPLILLTSLSQVFAEDINLRVSSLESRMTAIKNDTIKNTTGAKMASASPLFDGYGLFATADLLFWHLSEGGADYCLAAEKPGTQSQLPSSGKVMHSHFDWDFGFRTGVGYNLEHDAWDGYLNFTWFHTSASDSTHRQKNGGLNPQKGFAIIENAKKMSSHWDVHYYVLDLEVGRRYFVSKFLAFRPEFGVESAWICQRRRYSIRKDVNPQTGVMGENIYGKNNFWGIGPRCGVEGTWYFGRRFSLLGALNAALLWGRFDDHLKETELTSRGKVKAVDINGDFHRLAPNVQMKLGFGWDSNINDDQNHLGIYLSYEFQYWWRQNQFLNEQQFNGMNFQHEAMDLSLNGFTLDVRFDF